MGNNKLDKYYMQSILLVCIVAVFAVYTVFSNLEREAYKNHLCIYNNDFNKEGLGLSFIPDENCYGYIFARSNSIRYLNLNSERRKKGELHIFLKKDHDSWLKGRSIHLKEDELAFNSNNHFTSLMRGNKKHFEGSFDDYLKLTDYTHKDKLSGARILSYFNIGKKTELPFYISCFIQPKQRELKHSRCSVSFSYNSTVSVYVLVGYIDLENAILKVGEIYNFISNLII